MRFSWQMMRVLCVGTLVASGIVNTTPVNAATTYTVGSVCVKFGQQVTQNKQVLICAGLLGTNNWIQLKSPPKSKLVYTTLIRSWILSLSTLDFNAVDSAMAKGNSISALRTKVDSSLLQINLNSLRSQYQTLQAQSTSLATQILTDNSNVTNAKTTVSTKLSNYQSVSSQLSTLSSSYSAAMSDRAASLVCAIGVMFGKMGGPCYPENPLNLYVIAQYNSLKSQTDTAYTSYQAAQTLVNSTLQTYYADGTKKEAIDAAADVINQNSQVLQAAISRNDQFESDVNNYATQIQPITSAQSGLKDGINGSITQLQAAVNAKSWSTAYSTAYALYSGASQVYKSLISLGDNLGEAPVVPTYTPQAYWIPTGDYQGSSYSDLKISGPDFAWSWSKFYACTGSCVVAQVTAQTSCSNAAVTLDWKDSSSTKVGSTVGLIASMTVGTIYPVAFTLPSTLDATKSYSAYMSGFQCTRL